MTLAKQFTLLKGLHRARQVEVVLVTVHLRIGFYYDIPVVTLVRNLPVDVCPRTHGLVLDDRKYFVLGDSNTRANVVDDVVAVISPRNVLS